MDDSRTNFTYDLIVLAGARLGNQRLSLFSLLRPHHDCVRRSCSEHANPVRSNRPSECPSGVAERSQPLLQIPFFPEKPGVCIASTLLEYINRTRNIRSKTDKLFISLCNHTKKFPPKTISRWIKHCLSLCSINTDIFTGHSTRHSASSKADAIGIDLDTIRRTAGWSEKSEIMILKLDFSLLFFFSSRVYISVNNPKVTSNALRRIDMSVLLRTRS
ncbi:unnamed protein product [Trichogramma brassicae]|uniref:Tyr recombinase domain-containing protein n=1 Tax=Trichogramma brassicae TaxID=86971 RepID=A0A6H5HWF4_9HYME|nr:unnamed protein product [Trichogramma brassicae]